MPRAIQRAVRERGISRLCHFTRICSLTGIFSDGHIWSAQQLLDSNPEATRNDYARFDGHLNHVSCSIEYPNVYVLESYRRSAPQEEGWVILLLTPKLLPLSTTQFSSVNAARESGIHVRRGIDGFNRMYVDLPPSNPYHRIPPRQPSHLRSCPTDLQAEGLVQDSVPVDCIIGAVVKSDQDAERVRHLSGIPSTNDLPINVKWRFFEINHIRDRIQMGYEMPLSIKQD